MQGQIKLYSAGLVQERKCLSLFRLKADVQKQLLPNQLM